MNLKAKLTRWTWGWSPILGVGCISSCQKEFDLPSPSEDAPTGMTAELLVFQNKEQLEIAINQGKGLDAQGRSLSNPAKQVKTIQLRALGMDSISELPYSALVPEASFRKLLNERGEVQVGDTIYCITPAGTFFAPQKALAELRSVSSNYKKGSGVQVQENLFRVGDVYLYETFANADFSDEDMEVQEDQEDEKAHEARSVDPVLAAGIPLPDLNSFPKERGRRITWAGKIFQSISVRKSHVATFPANRNRRVNCAVYDFNYVAYHSIGITSDKGMGTLVGGDFFAIAYNDSWEGYNLSW